MSRLDKYRASIAKSVLGTPKLKPQAWQYFFEGVNISQNRSYIPVRAQNSDQTAIPWVRTVLLSHARRLAANVGFVRGAIRDLQMFTLGPNGLIQKSMSVDTKWSKAADDWFEEWSRIPDASNRLTFRDIQYLSLAAVVVDGDHGLELTETDTGFPKLVFHEGHTICNQVGMYPNTSVYDNDPTKPQLVDGILLDRWGRPIGVQVQEGEDLRKIDIANFVHVFEPDRASGHRGLSHFGPVLNHLRDIEDTISYMKTQVKWDAHTLGWKTTLNGTNGQNQWDNALNANTKPTDVTLEQILQGHMTTLAPGESLNIDRSARPSPESMALIDYLESDTLLSLGLPSSWKNLKVEGGATLRAALLRAQYRFQSLQNTIVDHELRQVRNWAIAKAAKRKDIPPLPSDWHKHTWQGPALLTADVTKVNRENREDIMAGLRSPQRDAAEEGKDFQLIRDEVTEATEDWVIRAEELAKKHSWLDPQMALHLLSKRDPIMTRVNEDATQPPDKV